MIELDKPELTDEEKKWLGGVIQNETFKKFLKVIKVNQVEEIARNAKNVDPYKLQKIGDACAMLTIVEQLDETMKVYTNIIPENS